MTTQSTVIDQRPAPGGWSTEIPERESRGEGGPIIPRLRICQPTSSKPLRAGVPLGQWYLETRVKDDESGQWETEYAVVGHEVTILPLRVRSSRVLFHKRTGEVLCRSTDGVTGKGTPGGDCRSCPNSRWDGDDPPACPLRRGYASYTPKGNMLAELTFQGGTFLMGEDLGDALRERGWGRVALHLGLELREKGRESFYRPVATYLDERACLQLSAQAGALEQQMPGAVPTPGNGRPAMTARQDWPEPPEGGIRGLSDIDDL